MKELLKEIGSRVRKIRTTKKLSQEDLAGMTEIDRSYISEIENGLKNPSVTVLYRIAEALGVKVADLLPDQKNTSG